MELLKWSDKFKSFHRKSVFFKIKSVLEKIPGFPIQIEIFYLLTLKKLPHKAIRGYGQVRDGKYNDIQDMCLLENKRELFKKRFKQGIRCLVAVDKNRIIGYLWFTAKVHFTEELFKYKIKIPEDAIYAFDGLIMPEYRLRGIWVLFQKKLLEIAAAGGRYKILTTVNYGNAHSLKTHLRFGYIISKEILLLRFFEKRFFKTKINYFRVETGSHLPVSTRKLLKNRSTPYPWGNGNH